MPDGLTRKQWELELGSMRDWNKRHMLSLLAYMPFPNGLIDFGCGDGAMVQVARGYGIQAFGVDQLVEDTWPEWFIKGNLVDHLVIFPVDIVLCLEVAEHLHSSAHATLCDTLCDNLAEHGTLIFSAAHPGQGGMGHLAERPAKYWHDQFALRKLNFNKQMTLEISILWSHIHSPLYWLPANVMVFEK